MANIEYIEKVYGNELRSYENGESEYLEMTMIVLSLLPERYWRPDFGKTDNACIQNTKKMMKEANNILSLSFQKEKFPIHKRNEIRASLMLCEGMLKGETGTILNDHPALMARYINKLKVTDLSHLPTETIDAVVKNIVTHHVGWNGILNSDDARITDECAGFVNVCAYLSSSSNMMIKEEEHIEKNNISEITALEIVSQMVSRQNWDGVVYTDTVFNEHFIVINGVKLTVPEQLLRAFFTIGQAIVGCNH